MKGAEAMSLAEQIRALYRENPQISGQEILARTGHQDNPTFWRVLNKVQVDMRGVYPGKRRNSNAHNKGPVYFIPPPREDTR